MNDDALDAATPIADLTRALRAIFRERIRPRIAECCNIDDCGRAEFLEYDHISPSFDEIANECLALMTADEIATKFQYDPFDPDRRALAAFIPPDHPAVVHLIATHRLGRWQWLCPRHHRELTAARRPAASRHERTHRE